MNIKENEVLKNVVREFVLNKKYIVYTYLLTIFVMLPHFVVSTALHSYKRVILIGAIFVFLIFLSKFNKFIYAIFVIYLNIANILIFHTFIHWGYNGSLRMQAILESPPSETFEYLNTYIDWQDVLLLTYAFFIFYFLFKLLRHYKHSFKIIKYIGLLISVSIIFGLSLIKNPFTVEPLGIPWEYYKARMYLTLPKQRSEALAKEFQKSSLPYVGEYDKVVIIQGESVNKHHMSLYGYSIKTTPFFDELKKDSNFLLFDAIAPANQTRLSVPLINTPATVHNFLKAFMQNYSLIGLFRRHSFKTYCISGQRASGMTNATIGSMGEEADEIFYANLEGKTITDLVLVDYLRKIKDFKKKEMYFIHLIGSHFDYNKRYNKNISLFANPSNKVEEYDNTIYFTDYVLRQIFTFFLEKFAGENILIVYTSDHGEVVQKNKAGHGFVPPYKEEYDVPFVIYSTIENRRLLKVQNELRDKLINLESLYDIVKYITGLTDELNVSYSTDINCLEPENIYDYKELIYSKQ